MFLFLKSTLLEFSQILRDTVVNLSPDAKKIFCDDCNWLGRVQGSHHEFTNNNFAFHVTKQMFTFSRISKIEVVQNVKTSHQSHFVKQSALACY